MGPKPTQLQLDMLKRLAQPGVEVHEYSLTRGPMRASIVIPSTDPHKSDKHENLRHERSLRCGLSQLLGIGEHMKNAVLLMFLLVVSAVMFGQNMGGMGGGMQAPYTNTYVMPSHPEHAGQHAMATEQSLVGGGTITSAQGEQPLWQFGSDKVEVPLGSVARESRKLALYVSAKFRIY